MHINRLVLHTNNFDATDIHARIRWLWITEGVLHSDRRLRGAGGDICGTLIANGTPERVAFTPGAVDFR